MKVVAVIPARYSASRFPGKLLQPLGKLTVLTTTYLAVEQSKLFDEVIVAADDQRIINEVENIGGKVLLTSVEHQSGSDRIAEVIQDMDVDVIVNVQGDEPFTEASTLATLIKVFKEDKEIQVDVATLKEKMTEPLEIQNPNNVKVVTDNNDFALYFSRSPIPFERDKDEQSEYYKHVGIYAYRKNALMDFTNLPQGRLEKIEKLEQLRYLENGYKIKVVETLQKTIGIDTPEDLQQAEAYLKTLQQ